MWSRKCIYLVLEKKSKYFKIKIGNREDNVSIDRLKAVISIDAPTLEEPFNKGRPKKVTASNVLFSVSVLLGNVYILYECGVGNVYILY